MHALRIATPIVLALTLAAVGATQPAAPAPVSLLEWSFDVEVGGWQSSDPNSPPTITADPNVVRGEEGGAVLELAYTPALAEFTALVAPVETGLGGGKSLHYWLRTTDYSLLVTVVTEADGSEYAAIIASLPETWQEVALDLGAFGLGDDSSDENGRLDPDQIRSVAIVDATPFLAQAAAEETFIVAPDLGPRIMWLDDFSVSTQAIGPRWQSTQVDGRKAIRFESFEHTPLQWFILAGKGITVDYDPDRAADGDFSLRIAYDLPPGKLIGTMTGLTGVPLQGMKRLLMSVMSEESTILLVQLKEHDESEYNKMIELAPGDDLTRLEVPFDQLALGDDSTDENGQLDLDQIKELTIVDISLMTGTPVQVNTLWLDDIVFTE
jgi:hypothetical protein